MLKSKLLIPVLAVTVGSTALFGVNQIYAQDSNNPNSSLVQKIAQKFNLDQSQVQAVFDEHKSEHHAVMKQKMSDRLTQLVSEGKITDAQKQAIIAKMSELKGNFNPEAFKDLTPEQRRQKMEEHRTEMENWAKSQGIDPQYLMFYKMGKGMHGEFSVKSVLTQ